jgi:di/tricarboxylate transporter
MTHQQVALFALFGLVLGFLLWGRLRYDLVAAGGLFAGVLLGLVPQDNAFAGFSNPAVLVVALVLVASRAFENSGALGLVAGRLLKRERSVAGHIALVGGIGAALSAVINNVAALALLMPVDIQAARKAGRSPSLTLMPLAFATVLGGLVTLIGTPPNIIASSFRQRELGAPYQMFDFAPVGLAVALAGVAFIALVGWRLLPKARREAAPVAEAEEFMTELAVPDDAPAIGKQVGELDGEAEQADVMIAGLIRHGRRVPGRLRFSRIEPGDVLIVEGPTDGIAAFIKALKLQEAGAGSAPMPKAAARLLAEAAEADAKSDPTARRSSPPAIIEAVVRADARIAGRSAASFRLRSRFGVTLLGVAHEGRTFREQVRTRTIEPGDVLLLAGPRAALNHVIEWLGAIPINETSVAPAETWRIVVALGLFAVAIATASIGWLSFTIAIGIAVVGYAATGLVPAREFYDQIDWPVVVMLACLLPLGTAFEDVGGTALIADWVLGVTHGQSAAVTLLLLMLVTMTLSNMLNNVATMVIAGPLAVAMAVKLGVSADGFLMGAAVATSSAFLTPIGHKNNTLIMGPGGYAFGDYWRIGLPLQAIVLAVGLPMILLVWPL